MVNQRINKHQLELVKLIQRILYENYYLQKINKNILIIENF